MEDFINSLFYVSFVDFHIWLLWKLSLPTWFYLLISFITLMAYLYLKDPLMFHRLADYYRGNILRSYWDLINDWHLLYDFMGTDTIINNVDKFAQVTRFFLYVNSSADIEITWVLIKTQIIIVLSFLLIKYVVKNNISSEEFQKWDWLWIPGTFLLKYNFCLFGLILSQLLGDTDYILVAHTSFIVASKIYI